MSNFGLGGPVELSERELQQVVLERKLSFVFVLIVLALAAYDLIEDIHEGESLKHMVFEGSFFILAFLGTVYFWLRNRLLQQETSELRSTIQVLHKDSQFWKEEAGNYLAGLGEAIDKQFSRWRLTEAEKEVGLLLLKGLSHKEVANIRSTSDKTIRHQAASLYRKAELDGRAQLAAFFLEDLLLPEVRQSKSSAR